MEVPPSRLGMRNRLTTIGGESKLQPKAMENFIYLNSLISYVSRGERGEVGTVAAPHYI